MYLYMLFCGDNSLYTGIAADIKKRIHTHYHKLPGCAKYTKSHPVCGIAALWFCEDETAARKLEPKIKALPRAKKLILAEHPEKLGLLFPDFSARVITDIKFEDCI